MAPFGEDFVTTSWTQKQNVETDGASIANRCGLRGITDEKVRSRCGWQERTAVLRAIRVLLSAEAEGPEESRGADVCVRNAGASETQMEEHHSN